MGLLLVRTGGHLSRDIGCFAGQIKCPRYSVKLGRDARCYLWPQATDLSIFSNELQKAQLYFINLSSG